MASKTEMWKAMELYGAILMQCPYCKKGTPVYPRNVKGGSVSTGCLHCEGSIQVEGTLTAVKAEYPHEKAEGGKDVIQ